MNRLQQAYQGSILQAAIAAAGSKIAQKLAEGYEIEEVSEEEQTARIAECETCSQFGKNRVCGLCGCPMDYKTKLRYNPFQAALGHPREEVHCPLKKW